MKKLKTTLELLLITGLGFVILSTTQVSAQPLTKDSSTGNVTEVDISIDPAEPLPANGTVTISTEGATDMNAFPPEGVYVIISSDTVTVTNQTVDVGTADEEEDETESDGGSVEGTESNGGSDEGNESEERSEEGDAEEF